MYKQSNAFATFAKALKSAKPPPNDSLPNTAANGSEGEDTETAIKFANRHGQHAARVTPLHQRLQLNRCPRGGTVPGSELTLTAVPPGAKGSLVAAVSF